MATWIPPLELETMLTEVFAGTPEIFVAVAIMVIMGMAGYFRMNNMSMFFMLVLFVFMFAGVVPLSLLTFIAIFGGLAIGYVLSNVTSR